MVAAGTVYLASTEQVEMPPILYSSNSADCFDLSLTGHAMHGLIFSIHVLYSTFYASASMQPQLMKQTRVWFCDGIIVYHIHKLTQLRRFGLDD